MSPKESVGGVKKPTTKPKRRRPLPTDPVKLRELREREGQRKRAERASYSDIRRQEVRERDRIRQRARRAAMSEEQRASARKADRERKTAKRKQLAVEGGAAGGQSKKRGGRVAGTGGDTGRGFPVRLPAAATTGSTVSTALVPAGATGDKTGKDKKDLEESKVANGVV